MFLDIRIVHKQEEAVTEEVVQVLDLGDMMAVKEVQVLEESTILGYFHAFHIAPDTRRFRGVCRVLFQGLVDLHQAVGVMEIIVEVNEHIAASDVLTVFELDGDEEGADECDGKGEDADAGFLAGLEPHDGHEAQQAEHHRGEDHEYGHPGVVTYLSHRIKYIKSNNSLLFSSLHDILSNLY